MKDIIRKVIISFLLFTISITASILTLLLERKYLNILYNYHPDTLHYLTYSLNLIKIPTDFLSLKNLELILNQFKHGTGYYYIASLLKSNIRELIQVNIIIYSLTNLLLYYLFFIQKRFSQNKINNLIKYIFFFFILFLPYRLHLSTHILKETFLIFFLVIMIINTRFFFLGIIGGLFFRSFFFIYLLAYVNLNKFFKNYKEQIFLILLIIGVFFILYMNNFFDTKNYILSRHYSNMGGREFDQIPNFQEYELGFLLRSIIWPILFLTGGFSFFTKGYMFLILTLEILIMQFIFYKVKKRFILSLGLFFLLIIIAIYCTTYTSFFRYSYLALIIFFIKNLININDKKNWFNWY